LQPGLGERHHSGVKRTGEILQFGPVTLIPEERVVLKSGKAVPLTPKAYDLLAFLASNPGRLLTKDELMQAVWPDTVVEEANLAYNVFAIRKALGDSEETERYIETVPKRGYRFIARVERAQDRATVTPALRRPWMFVAAGVVLGAVGVAGLGRLGARPAPVVTLLQFQERAWGRPGAPALFFVSPDGRHLEVSTETADGIERVWIRTLSALSPRALPGTESAFAPPVIWSPDSTMLAFDTVGSLRKVSLAGGAPQKVCDLAGTAVGGSWNRAGVIIVGNPFGGVLQCPAAGGVASPATFVDPSARETHVFPSFLSDGRRFIYLRVSRTTPEQSGVYLTELNAPVPGIGTRLITTGFAATYVLGANGGRGKVVFARDGALFAQELDEERLALRGEPLKLADSIGSYLDWPYFSASTTTLVYRAPDPPVQLSWFDRQGHDLGRVGSPQHVAGLALSPDGHRILVARHAPQSTADQDLWLHESHRERRMTSAPTLEFWPVWSSDDRFVYGSGGGGTGVYQQAVGADRQLVFDSGQFDMPTSVSADGKLTLFTTVRDPAMRTDVWVRAAEGPASAGVPLVRRAFDQGQAQFSPDARWVAYVSNESGRNEVFVAEFRVDPKTGQPTLGDSSPVSDGGGFAPRWRGDGRELFYLTADGSLMVVEVSSTKGFSAGPSTRLFAVPGAFPEWGVTRDGNRFLLAVPVEPPPPFTIIQGWQVSAGT
jgi:eukaryotic-like serine/threonine-protein kinase